MIPKQELKEILHSNHFQLNVRGLDILRSHIELYNRIEALIRVAENSMGDNLNAKES